MPLSICAETELRLPIVQNLDRVVTSRPLNLEEQLCFWERIFCFFKLDLSATHWARSPSHHTCCPPCTSSPQLCSSPFSPPSPSPPLPPTATAAATASPFRPRQTSSMASRVSCPPTATHQQKRFLLLTSQTPVTVSTGWPGRSFSVAQRPEPTIPSNSRILSPDDIPSFPLGGPTFSSKLAFEIGAGSQPPVDFVVLAIDAVTCTTIAFRWYIIQAPGLAPVKGIVSLSYPLDSPGCSITNSHTAKQRMECPSTNSLSEHSLYRNQRWCLADQTSLRGIQLWSLAATVVSDRSADRSGLYFLAC